MASDPTRDGAINLPQQHEAGRAESQLSLSAADILARITDAVFALDRDWRFTYVNAQSEVLLQRTWAELIGSKIWDLFPEALGTASEREYRRAMLEQITTTFQQFYPPLSTWFEARAYPSPEGIAVFFRDITEQKRAEDALRASEEALRASEERLQDAQVRLTSTLSAGGIATWTWDVVNDRVAADSNMARLFSVSPEDAAGGQIAVYFQAIHPEDRSRVTEAIRNAIVYHDTYAAEYRVVLPDGSYRWLATRGRVERDAYGTAIALPGVVQDITEQAERGRRERFLTDLADRARFLADPLEVMADSVNSLGEFLGLSRCAFADIDTAADICTVPVDYCADASIMSQVGTFAISSFGAYVLAEFEAGRTVVVDDVRTDLTLVSPEILAAYEALGIRAHVTAPVVHSTRLVSIISCHSRRPRHWKAEEIELIQMVVERTWLTVEVLRQRLALVLEAEERRVAHERTNSILESITDAFYAVDSRLCFSYINRRTEEMWGRSRQEFLGQNLLEVFPEAEGSLSLTHHERVLSERVPTHFEALSPVLGRWLEVSIYPTADGGLSVFFRDITERRTLEEERERLAARERTIATQLQEALLPELPGTVPGLALTKYYQPALAMTEGVGGDFYDVFAVEKGCTALVVGDLSGKGLAAASQVATVRNMLRAFLYTQPTVAEAVSELNRVLAENNLLAGFTTLFVGSYESATGRLNYVNCGQEPGLVRHASTGQVEFLPPTGPILGTISGAQYAEATVTLEPGDALAIFTDGLTEVGPRSAMLGIEGVTNLLAAAVMDPHAENADQIAASLAQQLITGVDSFAMTSAHDDMCLLVGVVK